MWNCRIKTLSCYLFFFVRPGRTVSHREVRRADKWSDWIASEWSGESEASFSRYGGEGAIPKWRESERYTWNVRTLPNESKLFL